ncbi:MAG: hypothetical protein OXI79_11760 [Gammaproteobacteria bacterium]|nr:hypothetical protein [Gammaproteobacteria bacterium]
MTEHARDSGAASRATVEYRAQPLKRECGILVSINGQPAGWIFRNGRDGTFDFTLTDLAQETPEIEDRFMTTARYAGHDYRVYRRGLDTVGTLDVLKERIECLVQR